MAAVQQFNIGNIGEVDVDDLNGTTLRLKNSLTISELSKESGFTFEIDPTDELPDELNLETLETGMPHGEHYVKDYIGDTNQKSQPLKKSFTADEKVGDFTDVVSLMSGITSDRKIMKLIIRPGTSKDVVPNDGKVIYHYEAYAEGKEGPIDSSLERGFPNTLIFANGGCIQGLHIGLQTMRVGEIAKFWFHYDVAYRAMGIPPRIPPKANILCAVEIIASHPKEVFQDILQMPIDDRRDLPFEKIMAAAKELKAAGNSHYEKKEYRTAITRYRKGIDLLDNYPVAIMAQEELRSDLLGALYSNLAQAYLNTKEGRKACQAAKCGLRIPKYKLRFKLYFKFAKGKELLKEYSDSVDLCRKALGCLTIEQSKERNEITTFMNEMKLRKKAQEEDLKHMYEKMLGNDKGDENEPEQMK